MVCRFKWTGIYVITPILLSVNVNASEKLIKNPNVWIIKCKVIITSVL